MTAQSSAGDVTENTATQTTADTAVVETQAPGQEDATAQSSSAQDVTETALLDVVRAAAKESSEAPVPESSDGKDGQEPAASEAESTATANPEEQAKDESEVPFHKHPRWQEMLRERDTYKAGHEQYQQIQQFMTANALEADEVATGFQIMALMRQDPGKALEMLQPYMQSLELVTGKRLPEDLAQRVDDGLVDQETARETARLRIEAEQRRAREAAEAQHRSVEAQQTSVQTIQSAVKAVETEIQAGDPDYSRKQAFVMDRVRALIIEERPQTPEQAVAIVRRAHSEISDRLKPMVQRKPVQTVTSGVASTQSRPEPKSLLDVVRQAAGQTS
jgi:hypothetical protein